MSYLIYEIIKKFDIINIVKEIILWSKKEFNGSKKFKERVEIKELNLENLTNEDLLKAIIIWYKEGNTMLNLAKRLGERIWNYYQRNPEKFMKQYFDKDINLGAVKNNLSEFGTLEARLGFKTGKIGDYGHVHAKFRVIYDRDDKNIDKI